MIAKKLKLGDTLGIICPASAEDRDKIDEGLSFIQNQGFKVKVGDHVFDRLGYLAGRDEDRASDFSLMFKDKSIDAIICYRGGYGTLRTLPFIDFSIVQKYPKIFVGFSDITTYLNIIFQRYGLITFHGPMISSDLNDETTLSSLLNTLMNGYVPYTIKNNPSHNIECYNPCDVEGTLVGGNLSLICSTIGTSYEIDTKNKILFIEDVDEEPYKIDRMLTQLYLCGKLQLCKGIILGQFKGCTLDHYERSLTLEQIFEDRILSLNKPVFIGLDAGHGSPRLTIPIGAKVALDFKNSSINVLEPVVANTP